MTERQALWPTSEKVIPQSASNRSAGSNDWWCLVWTRASQATYPKHFLKTLNSNDNCNFIQILIIFLKLFEILINQNLLYASPAPFSLGTIDGPTSSSFVMAHHLLIVSLSSILLRSVITVEVCRPSLLNERASLALAAGRHLRQGGRICVRASTVEKARRELCRVKWERCQWSIKSSRRSRWGVYSIKSSLLCKNFEKSPVYILIA